MASCTTTGFLEAKAKPEVSCRDSPSYGRRLQPQVVDEIARTTPRRVYATFPLASDLSVFRDVTFLELSSAVNRFACWIDTAIGRSENFETLTYVGIPDIRYTVVFLAAVKSGYKVRIARIRIPPFRRTPNNVFSFSHHQLRIPLLPTCRSWSEQRAQRFFIL